MPFENSTNGSVVFTLDLFADASGKYPDIVVCGEVYIEVHHCLLGRSPPVTSKSALETQTHGTGAGAGAGALPALLKQPLGIAGVTHTHSPSSSGHATPTTTLPHPYPSRTHPLTSLAHITKIYSHPQAWGQCATFLSCYLKGVERQDVSSTSRAAELVAADASGTSAAISSAIAARCHGLEFLARGVEDKGDNCTRFFVLGRRDGPATPTPDGPEATEAAAPAATSAGEGADDAAAKFKSLISFTVPHAAPGALADSLAVFKNHGLNLTSINARPSGEAAWHYIFFVEFQGRKGEAGLGRGNGSGAVDRALEELEGVVEQWRWLGSWENRLGK